MAYTPQTWVDGDTTKPISAARLGAMETGIDDADSRITVLEGFAARIDQNNTFAGVQTITGRFAVNKAATSRQPINIGATLAASGLSGTEDKIGIAMSSYFSGDFTGLGGSNSGFAWGLNMFAQSGTASGDAEGIDRIIGSLMETAISTPAGVTFDYAAGMQVEAAFFGATAGATVTQMESLRIAAPKRKDGAVAGTATTATCLFIESPDAYNVSASSTFALIIEGGVSRIGGRIDCAGTILGYSATLNLQGDYSGAGKITLGTDTIGFFGQGGTTRPILPDAATVTAANIRTALINLGLCQ